MKCMPQSLQRHIVASCGTLLAIGVLVIPPVSQAQTINQTVKPILQTCTSVKTVTTLQMDQASNNKIDLTNAQMNFVCREKVTQGGTVTSDTIVMRMHLVSYGAALQKDANLCFRLAGAAYISTGTAHYCSKTPLDQSSSPDNRCSSTNTAACQGQGSAQ